MGRHTQPRRKAEILSMKEALIMPKKRSKAESGSTPAGNLRGNSHEDQ